MRYFQDRDTGVVYSPKDDDALRTLLREEGDYREVFIVPLDGLPETKIVRKGEAVRPDDSWAVQEDGVALTSKAPGSDLDPFVPIRDGEEVERLRRDAIILLAVAGRIESELTLTRQAERVVEGVLEAAPPDPLVPGAIVKALGEKGLLR